MKHVPIALAVLLCVTGSFAAEFRAADVTELNAAVAKARPGDVILLNAGEWKNADLLFRGKGEPGKPITLRAAEPGKAKLTGTSRLRIGGEHLIVEGLWFDNCTPSKNDIVTFREDSKRLASHCVLRDCVIIQTVVANDSAERKWVSVYGVGNRVERCHFQGKTSPGTLMVIWLPQKQGEPPRHQIAKNYFGPRPRLGKNGGEIIRIGDSDTSMQDAECVVEGNLFERCDGEVECVSNKSCGNIYRGNTFLECQGSLTLRHGNGCLVEKNVFMGNSRKGTGGIRVIGEDHRVIGNHLDGIEGDEARAAICLMNGIENSPANGYLQVKRALIERNTLVNCKQSITIGYADKDVNAKLPPLKCGFSENTVWAGKRVVVVMIDRGADVAWRKNRFWGGEPRIAPVEGVAWEAFARPDPPIPGVRAGYGCAWFSSTALPAPLPSE